MYRRLKFDIYLPCHDFSTLQHFCSNNNYSIFIVCRASDVDIALGTTNLQNTPKFYTNTSRIIIHEFYSNTTYDHDIALVRLYTSLPQDTLSIKSPSPETLNNMSSTLFVMGWNEKGEFSGNLSSKNVTLVDSTDCTSYYESVEVDGDSKFCVVGQNGPCHGDSGGPVFNPRDLNSFLVGIVSAGHTNCSEATPTVCTKVAYYREWILKQISCQEKVAWISKNTELHQRLMYEHFCLEEKGRTIDRFLINGNVSKDDSQFETDSKKADLY
jgi:secreted trypsin-like serine protease